MAKNKRQSTMFRLSRINEEPATAGKFYPVSARIPSVDEIYDEKTGKNRKIRYVIGEQSIFVDEQKSDKPVIGDVVFTNGILIVPFQKPTLRDFLRASNYNEDNPDRIPGMNAIFHEVNNEYDAQREVEALENEFAAIEVAMQMTPEQIIGVSKVLGINTDRSMYEIKHDFLQFVKHNPNDFLNSLDDPRVDRKQRIIEAEEAKIIINNKSKRTIDWGGVNGQSITIVPVGVDGLDHLTEFTFEKEGEEVYSRICRLLEKSLTVEETPVSKKKTSSKK